MRGQQIVNVVLGALSAAILLALPAGAAAGETGGACANPVLFGQSDDVESWFRLPQGRNAEHIYFGNSTVEIEIHDLTTEHNFRIRDISWEGQHVDLVTGELGDPAYTGIQCWTVPLEVRSGVESGDYFWRSDQDQNLRYGVFINHPVAGGPPPRHPGRLHHPGLRRPRGRRRHLRRSRTSSSLRARASRSAPTTPTGGA